MIIMGAIIATLGKRLFPFMAAKLAFISVLFTVIEISGAAGWTENVLGLILTFLLGMALSLVVAMTIRRNIEIAVGVTGILGGLTIGNIIYEFLLASFDWESSIGWLVIVGIFGLIGGFLTFKFSGKIIILSTSFIGSYFFVRGWSLIIGGWPSEYVVWNHLKTGSELNLQWPFYVYLSIFLGLFVFTSWW